MKKQATKLSKAEKLKALLKKLDAKRARARQVKPKTFGRWTDAIRTYDDTCAIRTYDDTCAIRTYDDTCAF